HLQTQGDELPISIGSVHRNNPKPAAVLNFPFGDRGTFAIAIGTHGEHTLILTIDDFHPDDVVVFSKLDSFYSSGVPSHGPHNFHIEADAHPLCSSDENVLMGAHHAGSEELIA